MRGYPSLWIAIPAQQALGIRQVDLKTSFGPE
jgi:hypothetical protein